VENIERKFEWGSDKKYFLKMMMEEFSWGFSGEIS
jgi:hypothetical protein